MIVAGKIKREGGVGENVYSVIKKGGETSNSKRRNVGMANMHKKYRKQDRDPGWLDHDRWVMQ